MARKICSLCNTRPVGSGPGHDQAHATSMGYCNPCLTEADCENGHSDYGHDAIAEFEKDGDITHIEGFTADQLELEQQRMDECWVCHPELNAAQGTYVKQERKGHHSPRRQQINHRACKHAQTPKARRDCRNAYWAAQAKKG
jgi:hypothetical protein